jgi:hypothetical protein
MTVAGRSSGASASYNKGNTKARTGKRILELS